MQPDFLLVLGIIIGGLTVPAIFSAMVDGSAPRVAAFSAVVSGALIIYAIYANPGGYTMGELPQVFSEVIRSILR